MGGGRLEGSFSGAASQTSSASREHARENISALASGPQMKDKGLVNTITMMARELFVRPEFRSAQFLGSEEKSHLIFFLGLRPTARPSCFFTLLASLRHGTISFPFSVKMKNRLSPG